MFALSRTDEAAARGLREHADPAASRIDGLVSQFLIANNQVQEEAARANRAVYDRVGRDILVLVGVILIVTAGLGAWVVISIAAPFWRSKRSTRSFGHSPGGCSGSRRTFSVRSPASSTTTSARS